jgi:RecA/RadA recombinase
MSPRKKKEETSMGGSIDALYKHLKTDDEHYSFSEAIDYRVSSGSLNLDLQMGGGLNPGINVFSGVAGGGKTSCALTFAANFQKEYENAFVVYIKAEGRISDRIIKSTGVDTSKNKWLLYSGNIFENVGGLIKNCIDQNPDNLKFMFIIDSMDALIPKDDAEKGLDQAVKVAGGALLTSTLCKRLALRTAHNGHIALCICQVRSKVSVNPYAKEDAKLSNNSGGNALQHYANWILEFQPNHYKSSKFFGKDKDAPIGHNCKIAIRKSMTENSGLIVEYPIKYKSENGSVWVEREIISQLGAWEMIKKSGPWISFTEEALEKIKSAGYSDVEEKFQGEDNLLRYLEENPKLTKYFFEDFKTTLENLFK